MGTLIVACIEEKHEGSAIKRLKQPESKKQKDDIPEVAERTDKEPEGEVLARACLRRVFRSPKKMAPEVGESSMAAAAVVAKFLLPRDQEPCPIVGF